MLCPYNNKFWTNLFVGTESSYNVTAKFVTHHIVIRYSSATFLSLEKGDSLISQNVFILLTPADTMLGQLDELISEDCTEQPSEQHCQLFIHWYVLCPDIAVCKCNQHYPVMCTILKLNLHLWNFMNISTDTSDQWSCILCNETRAHKTLSGYVTILLPCQQLLP